MSRRLGVSLGVNLLPIDSKLCNFNCIYCECGGEEIKSTRGKAFNSRSEVKKELEKSLIELKSKNISIDAVTFAGNGEPTMHPEFSEIINDTIELRNNYFPAVKVAVLTNATMLNRKSVVDALKKVDLRILKLDAGTEELFQKINQPHSRRSLSWIIDHLQYFKGDLIVQSMFVKGLHDGTFIDNSSDISVNAWLELLKKIKPKQVMIYSIDRATAVKGLEKISLEKLKEIGMKVN
ncbi:MAG: radical SAM protein, partial [Bacteroidia bacterium]